MRFFWLALLVLYPVSGSAERLLDLGEIRFNHNSDSSYNGSFSSLPEPESLLSYNWGSYRCGPYQSSPVAACCYNNPGEMGHGACGSGGGWTITPLIPGVSCNCDAWETNEPAECPDGSVEQTYIEDGIERRHCGPDLNPENQDNCMFNPDGSMFCDGQSGEPEEGCNDPLSIYDGNSICASDKNACTRAGGTFGFAGSGSEMNGICIPFDDAEQIPTCSDLSAPIQNSDGSWRCLYSSELDINDGWLSDPNINPNFDPDDLDGDGIPNADDDSPNGGTFVPGRLPSDIDGDGIPDLEDGDMDGDGINNGSDDDADGDGILNEDDPTPDGDLDAGTDDEIEEEEEENEVSGGQSCDAAPTCSGDAAACAVVLQSWKTRCATEELADELTEEINEGDDGGLGDANTASNSLIDTFEQTALSSLGESSGLVAADGLGDSLSDALGFSYSCQDWVFSYQSINASITCSDTAPLRTLLAWAFGIFTLIAVFQIATRSPE